MMDFKTFISSEVIISFLICCTVNKCLSATKILSVESDKVCSPIKKRHIHLNRYDPPAVMVTEIRYFDTWLGDTDFLCKFKVESPSQSLSTGLSFSPLKHEGGGVFAVIQNFTLRQAQDGQCIDYIQFKQDSSQKSPQICGSLAGLSLRPTDPLHPFLPNGFLDPSGSLEVVIYIAKQKLEPGEEIDFSIVFTSYKECNSRSTANYRSCVDNLKSDQSYRYCISKELFDDGFVNCPFPGCLDENGCKVFSENNVVEHGTGTVVTTVGALAVIVLVFVCFLSALWILRKLHVLCWSSSAPAAAARAAQPPAAVHFSEVTVHDLEPTAPHPIVDPAAPDKDPPPSYESLFPPKPSAS